MMENRIKECRKARHMTLKGLAEKLNVSPRTVRHWEYGDRECDWETLVKLSRILEESIDYLLCNEQYVT